jgi:hypothetical protein
VLHYNDLIFRTCFFLLKDKRNQSEGGQREKGEKRSEQGMRVGLKKREL